MPLAVCPAATRRRRRICIVACVGALIVKVGPVVAGDLAIETIAYAVQRTLP